MVRLTRPNSLVPSSSMMGVPMPGMGTKSAMAEIVIRPVAKSNHL